MMLRSHYWHIRLALLFVLVWTPLLTACGSSPIDIVQHAIDELGKQPGKWRDTMTL